MKLIDILIFAVNAVMPIILVIALGYFLKQKGLLSREFLAVGNKIVFRILLPALLFTNLAQMESLSELHLDVVLYLFIIVAILFGAGLFLAAQTPDRLQKGVLLQCTFRSNFALIGVPLAQLIAGEKGIRAAALLSAFSIPLFNILAVVALSVYAEQPTGEERQKNHRYAASVKIRKILRDILHNPLILSVLAGILVVLLKPVFHLLPQGLTESFGKFQFVQTALDYLAKASTPVSLLVLGGQFELSRVCSLKKQIALGVIGRLVFAPILGVGGAAALHFAGILTLDNGVFAALVALFATPVAVASAIMAEEMGSDGQLAGQLVVWTTLFSSASIFLSIIFLRGLGLL